MSNNEPRESKFFAGKSAASPVEPARESEPPAPEDPQPTAVSESKVKAKPAKNLKKKKVSFYALPEDEDRARAAWLHTAGHTGHKTLTAFFEAAVNSYTHRLEGEYNDQKPFI